MHLGLAHISFMFLSFSFYCVWHDICTCSGLIERQILISYVGYRSGLIGLDDRILFDIGIYTATSKTVAMSNLDVVRNTRGNFTLLWWGQTKYKPLATNPSLGHVIWPGGCGDMAIPNQ